MSRGAAGTPNSMRLWVWPAGAGTAALIAALVLLRLRPDAPWLWPDNPSGATAMLQVIAGSVMTVTSLTFSLVIVTFQLASQQFSPRLLRELARDPVTKAVLAVLVATFVFAVTVLRGFDGHRSVPSPALLVAFLLGVASVMALLAFLTHIARVVRVDSMMLTVHADTSRAIETFYPDYGSEEPPAPDRSMSPPARASTVEAQVSGFLRRVDVAALAEAARQGGGAIRIDVRPGDQVVRGTPVATVWSQDEAGEHPGLSGAARAGLEFGYERTLEQDASFGFRQLTDIAVKALSPAINDPVTAAHAIGHMSDLTVRILGKRLGSSMHADADGVWRVVVPDRDLRFYLDLACGQVRRYGRREPTVLVALLRLLRDAAAGARDDDQRAEIRRQSDLILGEAADDLLEEDLTYVRDVARRVELALHGAVEAAFSDRSGETRAI